jgi:predicted aldo/keto reductase-like oxidoreductase
VIHSALLKWVLGHDSVTSVIPGIANHEQLRANMTVASNLDLSAEEESFLTDNEAMLGLGFCRQCRKCLASCPRGVDIPTLMRTHMYAAQYGDFKKARDTLDGIAKNDGFANCTSCETCTARCANTVDIDRRISELKLMYA